MESRPAHHVDAVVLAGSYKWTGSAFEELRARPLLPVAQKPLIDYVLGWLKTGGVQTAIVCGNGSTVALRAHLQGGESIAGLPDIRFYEDNSPRGAAGCVKDASVLSDANTLVVADGTSIPAFDLSELLAHHRRSGAALTIVAQQSAHETGVSNLHPVGVYVFERSVLDAVPATSFQDIKETLVPKLYRAGQKIEVFRVQEASPRVLNAGTYLSVNHWMISRLVGDHTHSASEADGRARQFDAHPTAWISPDAIVVGPVIIGADARVHAGATIIGPSSIGAGTVVEAGAVVARSVTWTNCTIGERAIVDQCVMGDYAVAPAGTTLAHTVRVQKPERVGVRALLSRSRQPMASPADAFAKHAHS